MLYGDETSVETKDEYEKYRQRRPAITRHRSVLICAEAAQGITRLSKPQTVGEFEEQRTDLANDLVCPTGIVPQAGDTVSNIKVTTKYYRNSITIASREFESTDRAIFRGFPLLRHSSSPKTCASRSMRSASLLSRRPRSMPVTFFPQVVLNASRAAATATSMSFTEPVEKGRAVRHPHQRVLAKGADRKKHQRTYNARTEIDSPATTEPIGSSVAGFTHLSGIVASVTHREEEY